MKLRAFGATFLLIATPAAARFKNHPRTPTRLRHYHYNHPLTRSPLPSFNSRDDDTLARGRVASRGRTLRAHIYYVLKFGVMSGARTAGISPPTCGRGGLFYEFRIVIVTDVDILFSGGESIKIEQSFSFAPRVSFSKTLTALAYFCLLLASRRIYSVANGRINPDKSFLRNNPHKIQRNITLFDWY